jgi:hypothetical protein
MSDRKRSGGEERLSTPGTIYARSDDYMTIVVLYYILAEAPSEGVGDTCRFGLFPTRNTRYQS